jgi:hypothetical protein
MFEPGHLPDQQAAFDGSQGELLQAAIKKGNTAH